jgi:hypothetical protein
MASNDKHLLQSRFGSGFLPLFDVVLEEGQEKLAVVDFTIGLVRTVTISDHQVFLTRSKLVEAKVRVVQCDAEPKTMSGDQK